MEVKQRTLPAPRRKTLLGAHCRRPDVRHAGRISGHRTVRLAARGRSRARPDSLKRGNRGPVPAGNTAGRRLATKGKENLGPEMLDSRPGAATRGGTALDLRWRKFVCVRFTHSACQMRRPPTKHRATRVSQKSSWRRGSSHPDRPHRRSARLMLDHTGLEKVFRLRPRRAPDPASRVGLH